LNYLITLFLISFITTYFFIPLIINFALNRNIVDYSDPRKESRAPIVRIGGLGIITGISFSLLTLRYFGQFSIDRNHLDILIVLSICFFILGFLDDVFKLSPWIRLFFQIIFSSLAWAQHLRIESIDLTFFNYPGNYLILSNFFSFLITVIWITGVVNAINWIDGLDGLAIGIIIFAVLGLILVNYKLGNFEFIFVLTPIAGSSLSFLKYNYIPAKVLMGDGGSYTLGYLIASTSLISMSKGVNSLFTEQAIAIVPLVLLLFIPIFDMSYVMLLRIIKGNSPFFPDRNHLHHRLIDLGISNKNVLYGLYSISLITTILAVILV